MFGSRLKPMNFHQLLSTGLQLGAASARSSGEVFTRAVSTSCPCHASKGSFEAGRQAKMLKKIMTGSSRSRRKFFTVDQHVSKTLSEFSAFTKGGPSKGKPISGRVMRRVQVLETLFIEQITSLLATGEVSPEYLGLGIQISKVKVTPDFSAVNVYWYASGTENDDKIESLLARTGGHLRHALSQLRVIGIVPPINFYKDKTFSKYQEVEQLLAKCDFGPDFKPTPASKSFMYQQKSQESNVPMATKNRQDLEKSLADSEGVDSLVDEDISVMRQDMLGVKHDLIMGEIMKAMKKKEDRKLAKERNIQIRSISDDYGYKDNDQGGIEERLSLLEQTTQEVEDHRKRQRDFLKYLKQRQAAKAKEMRIQSGEALEKEFYTSERDARYKSQLQGRLNEFDLDDDDDGADNEEYNEEEFYENFRKDFR